MSASNSAETSILGLIFNATAWADLAENDTSSPATSLYVSLHTGDPGEGGSQTTSECAYTSYARVGVTRNAGGWTVSGASVTNTAAVTFPQATGGSETATHFGIGVASAGAGVLLFSGALVGSLAISSGKTPNFAVGQLTVTAD